MCEMQNQAPKGRTHHYGPGKSGFRLRDEQKETRGRKRARLRSSEVWDQAIFETWSSKLPLSVDKCSTMIGEDFSAKKRSQRLPFSAYSSLKPNRIVATRTTPANAEATLSRVPKKDSFKTTYHSFTVEQYFLPTHHLPLPNQ